MQAVLTVLVLCMVVTSYCQSDGADGDSDVCEKPLERGSCQYFTERWYFNRQSCECKSFMYSGCGGNENNFYTKDACDWHCDSDRLKFCKYNKYAYDYGNGNGNGNGNGYGNGNGNGYGNDNGYIPFGWFS